MVADMPVAGHAISIGIGHRRPKLRACSTSAGWPRCARSSRTARSRPRATRSGSRSPRYRGRSRCWSGRPGRSSCAARSRACTPPRPGGCWSITRRRSSAGSRWPRRSWPTWPACAPVTFASARSSPRSSTSRPSAAAVLEARHPELYRSQPAVIEDELVDRQSAFRGLAAGRLDVAIVVRARLRAGPAPPDVELVDAVRRPPAGAAPGRSPARRGARRQSRSSSRPTPGSARIGAPPPGWSSTCSAAPVCGRRSSTPATATSRWRRRRSSPPAAGSRWRTASTCYSTPTGSRWCRSPAARPPADPGGDHARAGRARRAGRRGCADRGRATPRVSRRAAHRG